MSGNETHWGYIALGLLALLFALGAILVHRFNQRIRRGGIAVLATIVRMDSGPGNPSNQMAPVMMLTLEWTLRDGGTHTEQVGRHCDLACLPQQGDKVKIFYWPDNPALYVFAKKQPLRHDDFPAGAEL